MSKEEIHEIRMRNMRAVNDVRNYKSPEGAAYSKKYPDHDKLIESIMDLVGGNIEGGRDCMHAREMLDDIISDLDQLRCEIATSEEYLAEGLL
jgi:hypothetical protein